MSVLESSHLGERHRFSLAFMDSSVQSNILEIRRLLSNFDDGSISLFKQSLLNEVHCHNEKDWLGFVFKFLAPSLNRGSVAALRDKAIQIAESQFISIDIESREATATTSTKKEYPLCEWIQQQYKDKLSRLPSDIIDHIGSYLNKKESISIGYLNKQLYIESQKESYLNKRWKDKALVLNDASISRFLWKKSNPYSYSMPTELYVKSSSYRSSRMKTILNAQNAVFSSYWFKIMFTRLNVFTCGVPDCLPFVPVGLLFGLSNTNNQKIISMLDIRLQMQQLTLSNCKHTTQFCDRYLTFVKDMTSRDESSKIRNIYQLHIQGNYGNWTNLFEHKQSKRDPDLQLGKDQRTSLKQHDRKAVKKLLITLGQRSNCIKLTNCKFKITANQINKLFGINGHVRELSIAGAFDGKINVQNGKPSLCDNITSDTKENLNVELESHLESQLELESKPKVQSKWRVKSSLNSIVRDLRDHDSKHGDSSSNSGESGVISFLDDMYICGVMKNITSFQLYCSKNFAQMNLSLASKERRYLDYIFDNFDKYLSLNWIGIILHDAVLTLHNTLALFLYFIEKRQQLLDSSKCSLQIIYLNIYVTPPEREILHRWHGNRPDRPEILNLNFPQTQGYDINTKRVMVKVSECNTKEFGILYQNINAWISRNRQQRLKMQKQMKRWNRVVEIHFPKK